MPLLLGSLAIVIVLAPALYFWHSHQMFRIANALVSRANRLETQQDWMGAATYLHRYLQLNPGDHETRIRLAETFDRAATNDKEKRRAIELYYRAIGIAPQRIELRSRLAELLLETQQMLSAQKQAEQILEIEPRNPVGLRIRALVDFAQSRAGGPRSPGEALASIKDALADCPGDRQLVVALMTLCHDLSTTPGAAEREKLLASAVDRLVDVAPDSAPARLVRYHYLSRAGVDKAEADLRKALELAPDDPAVLMAAAENARRRGALAEAEAYCRQAITVAPQQAFGYLVLGQWYLELGEQLKAIATWREGLSAVESDHVSLNLRLAELLIHRRQLDEAKTVLDDLERTVGNAASSRSANNSPSPRPSVDLLRARWHLAQGNPMPAIALLKRVVAVGHGNDGQIQIQLPAWLLMGEAYAELRHWDLAAAAYERAIALNPSLASTRLAAAKARSAAGQFESAIQHCQQALKLDDAPPETWISLAQARFQHTLLAPKSQRNWQPTLDALARAEQVLPQSWEVPLLKAALVATRPESADSSPSAMEILRSVERTYQDSPDLWPRLIWTYEQLQNPADADRALQSWARRSGESISTCICKAELLCGRRQFDLARKVLSDMLDAPNSNERHALLGALARLERQVGNVDRARQHLLELTKADPSDVEPLKQLGDIALQAGNLDDAERWEKRLHLVEGQGGSTWQLYRARRLLLQAEDAADPRLSEALSLQAMLETQRPSWPDVQIVKAMIAERQGNLAQAIDAYQAAIRLGTRRSFVFERLIRALWVSERFDEAAEQLSCIEDQIPGSLELCTLAIEAALKLGQHDRAIHLARESATMHRDDPLAKLRLAQTRLRAGQTGDAEFEFQNAVQAHRTDARTWIGLFLYYVQARRMEQAAEVLRDLEQSPGLQEAERAFVIAQGYALLDNREQAEAFYRKAEQLAPDRADIKRQWAIFLSSRDSHEAERLLRRALESAPDSRETQRALAVVLANQPSETSRQEAQQLLRSPGADGDPATMRIEAALLVKRGAPDDLEKARQILERLVQNSHSALPSDRLNLASLYEAAGELPAARSQFAAVARQQRASASHVALYVKFLLRHNYVAEADTWLRKLERLAPGSWAALQLRVRWLKAAGQTEKIESLVEAAAERALEKSGRAAEQSQFLLGVADLYAGAELNTAAERWLRRLAREFPNQYAPLVRWLAKHKGTDEAVGICLQVAPTDTTPNAAILLAELLVQHRPSSTSAEAAESVFRRAVEMHREDANLLFAVSNLRLTQQRLDETIDLLQKITEIQPDNYLAWNNLAVVLAERPNGQADALRCIDRALQAAGRAVPALTDTKAMILLHQGEVSQAITLLKQIVAAPNNTDPRFYFHLALAFDRNASVDSARETLQTANTLGLSSNFLTPLEKNLLADLEKRVGQQPPLKDG